MRQNKSRRIVRIFTCICMMLGIGLLLYPWISSFMQEYQAASEIQIYESAVEEMDEALAGQMMAEAAAYNEKLLSAQVTLLDPFDGSMSVSGHEEYLSLLDMGDGIMGYLEIPAISVYLPVGHGTDEDTLRTRIGHLEGSSLPVGGKGTHAVLTGHTGLSTAKLFTDLIALEEGDRFFFHVLGETLTYEVTQILIAEPTETEALAIRRDEDLMTLVTCTPYGINSHRLYVTGTRVTEEGDTADAGGDTNGAKADAAEEGSPAAENHFTLGFCMDAVLPERIADRCGSGCCDASDPDCHPALQKEERSRMGQSKSKKRINIHRKDKNHMEFVIRKIRACFGKRIAAAAALVICLMLAYKTVSVQAESMNTFDPNTWSVDFEYNGYFSGWNGTSYTYGKLYWGACTEIGSAINAETAEVSSGSRLYYRLPAARSEEGYFKFEDAFIFTDPDTRQTRHYDIVVYAWSPTSWGSTSDMGVILACDRSEYEKCQFEFSTYAWVNGLTTYTNGTQTANLVTEWHFFETGTDTEADVSGIFYLNDNDTTEGYKVLSGDNASLYVQEDNVMTVDSEGYVVGTKTVEGTADADVYAVFSSTAEQPFQLGYKTSVRLCSHPISNGYKVSYSFTGEVPSGVEAPDNFYVSRFINTQQGADAIFPVMTAAGYSWDGWYTSSDLTGSRYTGTTSTQSSVHVYSAFTKLYGNLCVTKEIDTGQLDVETELSGFAFHLYGTSDAGDEVDLYAVTDEQGQALFAQVPICTGTAYQLEEVSAADVKTAAEAGNTSAAEAAGQATQDLTEYTQAYSTLLVKVPADDTNDVTWTNYLKQWRIKITKLDSEILEEGQAALGGTLGGAVYGLYYRPYTGTSDEEADVDGGDTEASAVEENADGGDTELSDEEADDTVAEDILVATYTTDENGSFTTDYQVCADGWYLREISPSRGYVLDDTVYYIDASAELFTEQYNTAHLAEESQMAGHEDCVPENAIHGKITLIKYGTNGEVLAGVTYELQNAQGTVLAEAITDTAGKAVFEDLVPGEYVIFETSTASGYTLLADPIAVTLPYAITAEEAEAYEANTEDTVWNEDEEVWMYYELTYRITDSMGYDLPLTGGMGFSAASAGAGVGMLLIGVVLYEWNRRRRF